MNKHLEIVGIYPPPNGGISVHVARMESFLNEHKIKYKIFNHGFSANDHVVATRKSPWWYIKYLFDSKGSVIHFHQFFTFHFLYYYFFSKLNPSKILITIHSDRLLYLNNIKKWFCLWLLKKTKPAELITVSKSLAGYLHENGIKSTWLPAYVPPVVLKPVKLPEIAGKSYFLFSIWKLEKKIAESVYNINLTIELLSKIKDHFHLLFIIGSEDNADKSYLMSLLKRYNVVESVTVKYGVNLVDYLENCKFFIRTNTLDGYGISVQEAMDLGVPAIASDVCVRPRGAILFKSGDLNDLLEKVLNINRYWRSEQVEKPDYHLKLLNLYKKYLC